MRVMPRVLFTTARSPYARKVRIALLEKGLPFELSLVDLTNPTPEFAARSPLGKVPLLVDEDGTLVFDSTVMVEYLEDRYPAPAFLGASRHERLLHRELDELGDTLADQAVAAFLSKGRDDHGGEARALGLAGRAATEIERRLADGRFPAEFGVGQAAVIAGLGYFVIRHGHTFLERHAALAAWAAARAARPSVGTTAPHA
jgi:glutathione S-transferase